jgi:short-subunit dehydrogenase
MKKIELNDARIILTGASSGIGKSLAYGLAAAGAKIALVARDRRVLCTVAEHIALLHPSASRPLFYPCDVSKRSSVIKVVQHFDKICGGVDILINNAGTGVYGEVVRTSMEDMHYVMDVNYYGAVNFILSSLPVIKKTGRGLIVNITSVAARYGVPFLGAYGASKAALIALSQSLRAELSDENISVMIVYPGYTQTPFFDHEIKTGGARRPEGPYMSPEKVARSIIRAMIRGKDELILSLEGKALSASQRFFPRLIDFGMAKIAYNLKT